MKELQFLRSGGQKLQVKETLFGSLRCKFGLATSKERSVAEDIKMSGLLAQRSFQFEG